MSLLTIDLDNNPNLHFRIDNFSVPDEAREEFEDTMRRNLTFLQGLPGFRGHVVFEKTGGPTTFNIVTIAVWESKEALDKAGEQVRAYYKAIGFDMPARLARWGVRAELGNFSAPRGMQ
ncbi:MAG TPA: antibiotic biosynthesis monooxygenase family protein [Archangium sp.]|nr:antibiotic biosynthesis monooxygenase family protein [Archangium sp.]